MQANKKDTIATWSAVGMLGFGVILTTAGFIIPPVGEVHDSILWILGQVLIYTGSIFGITMYTNHRLAEMSNEINRRLNQQKEEVTDGDC